MAFVGSMHGGSFSPAKLFDNHKPPVRHRHRRRPTPPIFISTNLSDVSPNSLRDLCTSCNHSFHRFPNMLPDGKVEPADVDKLRIALLNSSVVVSVFARSEVVTSSTELANGGDWYRRMIPLTPVTGELVGFGRAVSDGALTASIYDVMVIPPLQGRGIGRMILQRILRLLTNKGIYDIAALCSDQDMKFFKACGFGDDMLGSTTMMYTRSGSDLVVSAGIKMSFSSSYCMRMILYTRLRIGVVYKVAHVFVFSPVYVCSLLTKAHLTYISFLMSSFVSNGYGRVDVLLPQSPHGIHFHWLPQAKEYILLGIELKTNDAQA